jgi:hypothetical protein
MDAKCVGCFYLLHEISDNLLQFKPFNYPRKLTFFLKNQQFACLINAFVQFAYVSNMQI